MAIGKHLPHTPVVALLSPYGLDLEAIPADQPPAARGSRLGGLRALGIGVDEPLEIKVLGALEAQLFAPGGGHDWASMSEPNNHAASTALDIVPFTSRPVYTRAADLREDGVCIL
jgi:hypothetical protein